MTRAVWKQFIWSAGVNNEVKKLNEINLFYRDVMTDDQWQKLSKESDPVFWDLSTNENTAENDDVTEIDSDKNIEGNNTLNKKQKKKNRVSLCIILVINIYIYIYIYIYQQMK